MLARQVKSMKIIIESQGYICHRAAQRTVKSGFHNCIPAEAGYLIWELAGIWYQSSKM
jgi:hypothetical protein